jgi:hypothetical protein
MIPTLIGADVSLSSSFTIYILHVAPFIRDLRVSMAESRAG